MSQEIERKFLVHELPPEAERASRRSLRQGYLAVGDAEVRLRHDGDRYRLTCKRGGGLSRREEEIDLAQEQFDALWPLTESLRVQKIRYRIPLSNDLAVELDVYQGDLAPLKVAEVEFPSESASQRFDPPDYFGPEVTDDPRYKNQSLAQHGAPVRQE